MSALVLRNSKLFAYDYLFIFWVEIELRLEKLTLSTVRWNLGPSGIWRIKLIKNWEIHLPFTSSTLLELHLYSRHYRWQCQQSRSNFSFVYLRRVPQQVLWAHKLPWRKVQCALVSWQPVYGNYLYVCSLFMINATFLRQFTSLRWDSDLLFWRACTAHY